MIGKLQLPSGNIDLPTFLPDGTRGVVRAVDAADLDACHVQAVQMNVFHLMQRPGSSTIQALGGLHQMAGWPGPIFTDSGGFQIYSLIRQNPRLGRISERGAIFKTPDSNRKFKLTPEKSIQLQIAYGADVVICLDDCTHVDDSYDEQSISVDRTVKWARRSKNEFSHLLKDKQLAGDQRPRLVAVIQGGDSQELRRRCAEELLEIGFDGYGYGGWPLNSQGELLHDPLAYTRELVPKQFTLHALGVGHPAYILACVKIGYELFDSTLPTRDARHGRLYVFNDLPDKRNLSGNEWFKFIYINDKKYIKRNEPLSPYCDCHGCSNYSLGYLHHLYKINDHLYARLATMHNLRFLTQLMSLLRI